MIKTFKLSGKLCFFSYIVIAVNKRYILQLIIIAIKMRIRVQSDLDINKQTIKSPSFIYKNISQA